MGKRKRGGPQESTVQPVDLKQSEEQPEHGGVAFDPERSNKAPISFDYPIAIQIVVGTYEKVLHGVTATIRERKQAPATETIDVEFADTFLFSAHTSAIRCLAFSPPSSQAGPRKVFLASGASDQVVNLYQLSTEAPSYASSHASTLPVLSGHKVLSNPGNRELGSLQNHGGGVNELHFPTRSKLMSAAEDCTIAITRTRDWSMLSTIKTPIPKLHGRPSGDTAPLGGAPSGVNGFAVHPSMKLMVSVSKGEKCMRLWNLVTGKKAGVLNFEKQMLQKIGEAKWASGEGRRVRWNNTGDEFTIAFEKGCVTYGLDSKVKCLAMPSSVSKIHQLHYVTLQEDAEDCSELLAVSTEDGRILLFLTTANQSSRNGDTANESYPVVSPICQLGGANEGLSGRIKDFQVLRKGKTDELLVLTCNSDGAIRLWALLVSDLLKHITIAKSLDYEHSNGTRSQTNGSSVPATTTPQVGRLLGTYEAGNRITCLAAFVMDDSDMETKMINGEITDKIKR